MKELVEAITARVKSPIYGYLAISWIFINWKQLLVLLFDATSIQVRIDAFEKQTTATSLVVLPLVIGVTVAVLSPWFSYLFLKLARRPTDLHNALQAEAEHNLLLKRKQLEEARATLLAARERELIARAKRDQEVGALDDENSRVELQKQLDQLRAQVDKQSKGFSSSTVTGQPNVSDRKERHETARQLAELLRHQGNEKEAEHVLRSVLEDT